MVAHRWKHNSWMKEYINLIIVTVWWWMDPMTLSHDESLTYVPRGAMNILLQAIKNRDRHYVASKMKII